jgi:hypothetical protein
VEVPFVAYRNLVFRCGGFPAAVPGDRQWTIRRELASGLLDLERARRRRGAVRHLR